MARLRALPAPPREALPVVGVSWSRHLRAEGKSPQTISTYLKAVHSLADFLPPETGATAVSRDDLIDWLNYLRDELHYRPATLAQRHRSIQQLFRWMVQEGDIDRSPLEGLSPPRIPDSPPPVLTIEQQQALLEAVRGSSFTNRRDTAILRTFMSTGMRRAEMTGIKVADLDLDRELITITGKGGHTRQVSFGRKATQALDRYLRVRASHKDAELDALWLGKKGALTAYGIEQLVKRAADDAELGWVACHTFRHSWAAGALALGLHEQDVSALAGWRSQAMVARYGRAVRNQRAQANHRANNPGDQI